MDWAQLWEIVSLPDNVPIVALAILVPFYAWYGLRQARATDRLTIALEADPQLATTAKFIPSSPVGPARFRSGPSCSESNSWLP